MDRICPFLALSDDHRTVIDGFDPDHACHARRPPEPLDRVRQAELCLAESHRTCEFYVAFLSERAAGTGAVPQPAADSRVARTRLILEQDPRRLRSNRPAAFGTSPRRWLVAGGIAAVGVAAAATAVGGGFRGLVGEPISSLPEIQPTADPTASPLPTPVPTLQPSPTATPIPPTPTPAVTPTSPPAQTPAATTRTYVVREGDTLSLIATRFGTSVSALQAANGLGGSDVITIGQVLVIP